MDYLSAFRTKELTDEEMQDTVCTCPENPNVDEYGDNSWLPCMSMMNGMLGYPVLRCKSCIYCQKKN